MLECAIHPITYRTPLKNLFLHTIYSVSKLIDVLYFVLIYTQKGLFQWPSYRGEGILATVVKQKNTAV